MVNITLEDLNKLKELGYVKTNAHNTLPLSVWNYTPIVQFNKLFGEHPLLRLCRGLIVDNNGKIAGRGFEKFFNWEEHQKSELPGSGDHIEITKKMDGSLLIVFRYNNQVVYSTRGSFYSDQAIAGGELFRKLYNEDWIEDGKTYLFEFIGPENRIVVQYEQMDLIHIAVINNFNGYDLPRDTRFKTIEVFDVDGGLFSYELFEKLKILNNSNEEGYVIRQISDGTYPDWRCKIKFDDYIKLHRILTGVSNKTVWEILRDNSSLDTMIEICPDEFNIWLRKVKEELENQYMNLETKALAAYDNVKYLEIRKEQALQLMKNHSDVASIVFKMLDGLNYSKVIWNMIKPNSYIQPFANKGEE